MRVQSTSDTKAAIVLNLFDRPFRRPVFCRAGGGHVDRVGSLMQTGTFGGLASPAVGDDVMNELPAVPADLHGAPVFC